jgi:hypothetical protein
MIETIALIVLGFIVNAQTPRMTDRAHDGFVGPVQKVFVEWSPVGRPYNDIPVGAHCRQLTDMYDRNGRLVQHSVYPGSCGSDETRYEYTYAGDGSRTSLTREIRSKDNPSPPPPANMGSTSTSPQDVGPPRVSFIYDSEGKLAEMRSVRPSGKLIYRYTYLYDAQGRLLETTGHDTNDQVSDRRVYGYGNERVPMTFAYYGRDGKIYDRITYSEYEFNSIGDWTKRKETTQEGLSRNRIFLVTRTIEYYSPN